MTASMVAVPWAAAAVTVKAGVAMPSASVAVSTPLMTPPSSLPMPVALPPNTVASLTGVTVTVTVAVSVTPPEVTV
ncbi:hypothetical protein HK414_02915 [Ramlibacter terrae]|uniref:Secreted protein n=1 Tax=Ramlibacter terrae TaxID=2732511 RepID=A0ABX6P1B4_9BURK|nr:hypothetical protein HK414_02915 [Ramlibacter terrae]